MPEGSKEGGGLKVKSAYKSYTPYKMLGHELPGPNQYKAPAKLKAFGTKDSDMPDGISTSPGKYAGGVGESPAKFPNIVKNMFKKKKKNPAGVVEDPTAETGGDLEGRVAALETAASGGDEAVTAPPVADPTVKPDPNQAIAGGVAGEQAEATASIDPNKQSMMDKLKPTNQAQGKFMGV